MTCRFKKGDRVEIVDKTFMEGRYGTVKRGGKKPTVIIDGGECVVKLSARYFKHSSHPKPKDEVKTRMDNWSVKNYKVKRNKGEPPCFECVIYYNQHPSIIASNDGFGTPNTYIPHRNREGYVAKFKQDVSRWCDTFSKVIIRKPDELWIDWKVNHEKYGVTAENYLEKVGNETKEFAL